MASISSPPTRVNLSRLKSEKQTLTKALAISGCSCRNSLVMMGKWWMWWVSDGLNQYLSSLHVFFSSSNFDSKTRCDVFSLVVFFVGWVFPYYCFLCCLVLCPHEPPPIMVNILHNPRYHIVASEKMLNNSHVLMENQGVTNSLPSKH